MLRILDGDSFIGRYARRIRSWMLDFRYGRGGMLKVVNGIPLRVLPDQRRFFPAAYDPSVAAFLKEHIKPGAICLNVGANVGIYSLQLAFWSAPTGQVIAFEPNPATAEILRRHVELNGLQGRIQVVQQAVAAKPGIASFFAQGTEGMSRLGAPNLSLHEAREIQVEVTTLDDFCNKESVGPEWVLIDVEGFEVAVLTGFRKTLESYSPGLVVEMHPDAWGIAGSSAEEFNNLLISLRLRAIPLTGQRDAMAEHGLVYLERHV
jgi:FkbM family methyltransferase